MDQLINEGYIDEEKSELNKSHHIYYPVLETRASKGGLFDQSTLKTEETKIIVENPSVFPTKEYITSENEVILSVGFEGFSANK